MEYPVNNEFYKRRLKECEDDLTILEFALKEAINSSNSDWIITIAKKIALCDNDVQYYKKQSEMSKESAASESQQ